MTTITFNELFKSNLKLSLLFNKNDIIIMHKNKKIELTKINDFKIEFEKETNIDIINIIKRLINKDITVKNIITDFPEHYYNLFKIMCNKNDIIYRQEIISLLHDDDIYLFVSYLKLIDQSEIDIKHFISIFIDVVEKTNKILIQMYFLNKIFKNISQDDYLYINTIIEFIIINLENYKSNIHILKKYKITFYDEFCNTIKFIDEILLSFDNKLYLTKN